ncbi:MAG TPA: CRTAC1 family protein [Candidatus Acidoferrum sp.]|nr:CRTAC1 family protein [Candidatus Acidoferrum sp.]
MTSRPLPFAIIVSFAFAAMVAASLAAQDATLPVVPFPRNDVGLNTLANRKKAQLESADQFKVFYQFHFTDRLKDSGITFRNHAVPYATSVYMPVHYDHGTGLAVADVDGDGQYDIYFVSQLGGNELWRNLGNGKFENITERAGVGLKDRVSVSAAFGDVDNTGHQDLYVTTVNEGNVLFQNDGHGHFKDITHEAGLDLIAHSSGAFFFDFDNDGLLDLLVCNVGVYTTNDKGADGSYVGMKDAFSGHLHPERFEYPVLYKNLGHYKFKNVTAEVGLDPRGWCGDASFADLKGDGWPGIYFLNMQGSGHYFENEGGKKFVEKTQDYFPRTPWGSMGLKFFDFDNDGRMDLFVTDMHSDMMEEQGPDHEKEKIKSHPPDSDLGGPAEKFIFGNAFYHNLGNGKFEEISDKIGVEQLWPWGVSVGDLNADGYEDIFITAGMNFPFRYSINSVLLNNRGEKFLDSEFLLGVEPRQTPYTPWFVMDCTNSEVLAPLGKVVCEGQTQKVTLSVPKASRSSVIFDLDNDGDLDIVTNDFNSEPMVLISDLAQQKKIHWLKVVLVGTKSNRNGLGATVRLHANGQTYTRYNDGKSGYLSQSVLPLYFGLGESKIVDRLEVDWPSGRRQVITKALQENQTVTISEASK